MAFLILPRTPNFSPKISTLKKTHINGNSLTMELKMSLGSPTSAIRTTIFRRSTTSVYYITFIFILFTTILVFYNPRIYQSSEWLRNILKNRQLANWNTINSPVSENDSGIAPFSPVNFNSDLKSDGSINLNNDTDGRLDLGFQQSVKNETNGIKGNQNSGSSNNTVPSEGKNKNNIEKSKAKLKDRRWVELMRKCDIFDGKWVKDEFPPLYERGSCPYIDEPFNCFENGRPDYGYENFRWQPYHCNLPRLEGRRVLKFLKGKRIVYVGDSLNRNMWQSMVCLLRNSVEDKSRVFEASGRVEFRKEGGYSFLFPDYNCSVEYIRSAFLVQESEMPFANGSMKETLRIDRVENSSETYKDADILVFNTGHWWTHEKTSEGKGYYQEGNHVHEKMDVTEAFKIAMTTWAKWMQNNVNPMKTHVFFRGYSLSHFSEGEWNSGGKCDGSIEPIKDEKELMHLNQLYPPIPQMLENSLARIKAPVSYLNITQMTNYRRDAHPSIYRQPNITEEEKKMFLMHQDCSHWCLPGVPDIWNQLMFAQLLLKHKQRQLEQNNY